MERRVTFEIDDIQYMRKNLREQSETITEEMIDDIISGLESHKYKYTLIGNGNNARKYELVNERGNKCNVNNLNGYMRGVIIKDCQNYFSGRTAKKDVFGVVNITEALC